MTGSSQSRRKSKLKLEPISYEEMLGTAGMSGFVSFLDVTPADASRTPDASRNTPAESGRRRPEPSSHAKRELAAASGISSPPRIDTSQPAPLGDETGTPDTGIHDTNPSPYADQDGRPFTTIRGIPHTGVADAVTAAATGNTATESGRTRPEPLSHTKRELSTFSETSSPPRIDTSQPTPLGDEAGIPYTGIQDTIPPPYADQKEPSLTNTKGTPHTGVPDTNNTDHSIGAPDIGIPYSLKPNINNGIEHSCIVESGIPDSWRKEIQSTLIRTPNAAHDLGRGLDTDSILISSNEISTPQSGTPYLDSTPQRSPAIIQKQTSEQSGEPLSISICSEEVDPLPTNVRALVAPDAGRLEPSAALLGDGSSSEDATSSIAGASAGEVDPRVGIPESSIPIYEAYRVLQPRAQRIRRATRVQDGHSLGEQALYDSLWQAGHPYSSDARAITIGYRHMSELARLTVNNCKANIRALIQKLAVAELSPFSHAHGTTYLIYNFTAILQRRRTAGFTHCIRSRGVVFVDPNTGSPLTTSTHIKSGTPDSGVSEVLGVPESDKKGAPVPARSGIPNTGSHIDRNKPSQEIDQETASTFSGPPADLTKTLRHLTPIIDDQAVTVLWTECRARATDCTVEEILHFAQMKVGMFRTGKIQNPVGFLLAVVPKCFEGKAFQNFREEARKEEENQQQAERERQRARKAEDELARGEAEAYERAEEKLRTLPKDAYEVLYEKAKRELFQLSRSARLWSHQVLEDSIRTRILSELQRQELTKA